MSATTGLINNDDPVELEPDLEDIVGAACVKESGDIEERRKPYVMVEGKLIHKASILKVMGPGTSPHSFNRIKWVRGFSQFDTAPVPVQEGDSILGGTIILVNDPVASLI